ncbi:MAG TPA: hypothetical protein VGN52_18940 [Burkholderiales bacterium]
MHRSNARPVRSSGRICGNNDFRFVPVARGRRKNDVIDLHFGLLRLDEKCAGTARGRKQRIFTTGEV